MNDSAVLNQRLGVQFVQVEGDAAGQRIDNFLSSRLKGVPKSRIYKMIRSGEVRVNKGRVKPTDKLGFGDTVRIPPVILDNKPMTPPSWLLAQIEASILAETEHYYVINKPSGLAVHAGSGIEYGLIEGLCVLKDNPKLSLAHRIDRDTSGLVLVAKNRLSLNAAVEAFKRRQVTKRYQTLHSKALDRSHEVDLRLSRDHEEGGERLVKVDPEGQEALSIFTPLKTIDGFTRCAVDIHTGRTHQIRVHSLALSAPLVGDQKYGVKGVNADFKKRGFKHMFLHSSLLALNPEGFEPLNFKIDVPDNWGKYK
ncbi:MAG: RluA family pseudouridine synthase [Gammaproteobacteria bacterium]|nr:RluA family pseudouridine synthase [Gammaproteobacteria bacterium]